MSRQRGLSVEFDLAVFAVGSSLLGCLATEGVGFRDSGEIGAAGFQLGVAHPTGFAASMLWLRAAALLPLGPLAWRQNAATALLAGVVLALSARLCRELAARASVATPFARGVGAVVAVAALAGWQTFLACSLAVEAYVGALLLVAIACLGGLQGGRRGYWIALGLGLAPSVHVMCVLPLAWLWIATNPFKSTWTARRIALASLAACLGGALVAYLPLASLRDPPLDWGDPETPARLFAHLTGARIRAAYQGEMLAAGGSSVQQLAAQLAELWPAILLSVPACLALWARQRGLALSVLGLAAWDVVYAGWVNPMGVIDRQVGQLAGTVLCVLGGVGLSVSLARLEGRAFARPVGWLVAGALALVLSGPVSAVTGRHASLADELHGSGGPLIALPPRSVLLCSSDDVCAAALFALYVDGVRPDVAVLPAQHLWDPTTLRRARDMRVLQPYLSQPEPPPARRSAATTSVLRALTAARTERPLRLETDEPIHASRLAVDLGPAPEVPFLWRTGGAQVAPDPVQAGLTRLRLLYDARVHDRPTLPPLARTAWSQAFGRFARGALAQGRTETAVVAFREAVRIAPLRSAAWTNLGVALARDRRPADAVEAYQQAIKLDPRSPTPWVNLIHASLAAGQRETARRTLTLALQAGVRDPRLHALRTALAVP